MAEASLQVAGSLLFTSGAGALLVGGSRLGVFDDFEAELFDDRIGEHLLGDLLDFRLSGGAIHTLEIEDEKFALADVAHGGVAQGRQCVLDGGALRIEHGTFQHDPDVCFHAGIIQNRRRKVEGRRRGLGNGSVSGKPTSQDLGRVVAFHNSQGYSSASLKGGEGESRIP
jgi:hypothetical protein